MNRLALILPILLLSTAARAKDPGPTAYYDFAKVTADSEAGKANAQALNTEFTLRQSALSAARQAAATAKPADKAAAEAHVQQVFGEGQRALTQQEAKGNAELLARAGRVLPAILKARKLAAAFPLPDGAAAGPDLNVTADVIRRLDAGEGKTDEEAKADLQKKNADQAAEIAQLKAANAALTKPPAPAVPADPPMRPPLAAKARH